MYLVCWALWVLITFGVAFSPTVEGVIICRFLAGLMASPPLSCTGGVVSDLFARDQSGEWRNSWILRWTRTYSDNPRLLLQESQWQSMRAALALVQP